MSDETILAIEGRDAKKSVMAVVVIKEKAIRGKVLGKISEQVRCTVREDEVTEVNRHSEYTLRVMARDVPCLIARRLSEPRAWILWTVGGPTGTIAECDE